MAEILKPSDINKIWASAGDVLAPSDSKISTGWAVEIPPRQWFNYIDNKQDQAIAHINQHGIPVWDALTEYQWSTNGTKSLCMGSNGTIYRAKQLSVNQNPVTDTSNTYWEIAFANTGDFYTQTQSDARYLQKSANLSDLVNPATARANLSVYSQTQTYTKTEVDAKTTVATALQSQTQASNTVLITPLQLAQAMQGVNQSLTASGYQIFPGGLTVQWGTATVADDQVFDITLPVPFKSTFFCALATAQCATAVTGSSSLSATAFRKSLSVITVGMNVGTGGGFTPAGVCWIAIGI